MQRGAGRMVRIIWREASGREIAADVVPGTSLMRAALEQGVGGIRGECGGNLACATCHVLPDPAWIAQLGPPSAPEDDLLDFLDGERRPESRLSCQITASEALDGLILTVPAS